MENSFKKILKVHSYILIFCVFMGVTFLKFQIGGNDFNVARVIMLFTIPLLIINFFISKKSFKTENKELKFIIIFYMIWAIYSIISGLWCQDIKMYIIANFYIITGVASILYFTYCVDIKSNMRNYFYLMQIGVGINALYYIYLYKLRGINIGGFYDNSNDLAIAIVFMLPITIYLLYNSGKKIWTILYEGFLFVIYYYALMIAESRASTLGLLFGLVGTVICICWNNKDFILERFKIKSIVISILLVLAMVSVNYFNGTIGTIDVEPKVISEILKKQNIKKEDLENDTYTSNDLRTNLIYNGIYFLSQNNNWLHGVGTGNSIYYLTNYAKYNIGKIHSLHNFWLEILVSHGCIIFIGYLLAYLLICKNLILKIKVSDKMEEFIENKNIVFLVMALSFIFAGISSSNALTKEFIWIIFALILSFIDQKNESR